MPDGPANPEPRLPDDPALLKGLARELLATVREQQRRIDHLVHQVHQLTKRLYGPWADRLHPDQPSLFGEPPAGDTPVPPPSPVPAVLATAGKPGHGRRTLPADLRRETEVVDVPDAVKRAFGGEWVKIGEEVSEKLDFTPVRLFVRPKYAVRFPGGDRPDQLHVAELPAEAMPKSKAAPGLVADVVVSKLVDHLPLYRQERRYARQGIPIARSTLCGWLAEAADALAPLWQGLKAQVPPLLGGFSSATTAAMIWSCDQPRQRVIQPGMPSLGRF